MFFNNNNDVEQEEFKLSDLINELSNVVQKYGEINNMKIELLNHIDICDISFSLDYKNRGE